MGSKRKRGTKDGPEPASHSQKKAKGAKSSSAVGPATERPNLDKIPFIETPTGDERKREATLYDLLGSDDDSERIEAADCIVSCLLGGDGVPEPVLQRHINRRLFRGLASGRNASRIGFSLVITEILSELYGSQNLAGSKYPGLTFDKVLGYLTDKSQGLGSVPGKEERDSFFGQLFGLECFVRSQVLFTDISRWNTVLNLLLSLSTKKVWLRSQCGWVVVQALGQMTQKQAESTLESIAEAGLSKTPEGIAAWLVVLDRFPGVSVKPWRSPLASKSLGDVAAVLKESFQDANEAAEEKKNPQKQTGWSAQLHFVWDVLLGYFSKDKVSATEELGQFWTRVVDDGLFSKNATDGQKFKGFMVFQTFLEALIDQHDKLRAIFSKNLMACLMNQAAKEDRFLHRAATKTLKSLEAVVASHPTSLGPILQNLLNGAYNFDQRTSSKTIEKLLRNVSGENEQAVLGAVRLPKSHLAQNDVAQLQSAIRVYVDYLSKLLNVSAPAGSGHSSSNEGSNVFGLALQELSRLAYSQPEYIPEAAITDQIKELCRSRLEGSLAKMTRKSEDFEVVCRAILSIDPASVTMDDEIKVELDAALMQLQKLLKRKSKSKAGKGLTQALALLHAVSIFQLYNEDPDAVEVLHDLAEYSNRLKKGVIADTETGSSELLVEILLSMVARPSSLMRQVSQQVFEACTSVVSSGGLELLTSPLASGESSKGQKELFNTEDDDMAVDEEGAADEEEDSDIENMSNIEIGSDVEFVDLNGTNDEEGSSDDDEDEDDASDNDKQGPQDLDELVGNILRSHRLDKDGDAESSSSDADMSDSEMLTLDDKLAEVFKNRVSAKPDSKKQKKDAKQSVVNFKHRILDLLDIYVKNETLNPLAFSVLMPLLHLMRTTSTKPLASRACEIILNYQRGSKKARSGKETTVDVAPSGDLLPLLVEVHAEAGKDNAHAYAKAASAASLIVASAMFAADKETIKQIAAVYAKTQSDWVLGNAKLQNSFFADWNNWCQNHASQAQI